jgi:arginine-tRNA-protein transferase
MDQLWAGAWWFLGTTFFRQNIILWHGRPSELLHLRIDLSRFSLSPSQRRIARRNRDLHVEVRPPVIDQERRRLFDRHKTRFDDGIPECLDDFLGPAPGVHPVPGLEFDLRAGSRLVAVSYLAAGERSAASLYGIFDPTEANRSLGIYSMLLEIQHVKRHGFLYYYPGYSLKQPSCMDYKKRFGGLEAYIWNTGWRSFERQVGT